MHTATAEGKKGLRRGRLRRKLPSLSAGIVLLGIALMAVCAPLAAHYSREAAAAWFNESARRKAAYRDVVREEESSTGRTPAQFTAGEMRAVEKNVEEEIWSASYDPRSSTYNQGIANALGLSGVAGFFLFAAGVVATTAILRKTGDPSASP
jgi:hypothetical protein